MQQQSEEKLHSRDVELNNLKDIEKELSAKQSQMDDLMDKIHKGEVALKEATAGIKEKERELEASERILSAFRISFRTRIISF